LYYLLTPSFFDYKTIDNDIMTIAFTSKNDKGFEDRLHNKNNKEDNSNQQKIMRAGTTML